MKVTRRQDRLDAAGGLAVFVVHDHPDDVRSILLADLDPVRAPIVVDLDRENYARWGLVTVPRWRIWLDPKVWTQYARLLATGERIRGAGRDIRQLGGDFVVAPGGRLVYARPQRRDDRPPAGVLVDRLEAAAG